VLFRSGSFLNMVLFTSKIFRKYVYLTIGIVAISMFLAVLFGGKNYIFLVEMIGMLPISAYLIFKAIKKIY